MVAIQDGIQRLIEQEQVIVVGSVDKKGIPNVSPRSALFWNNVAIFWLEFFDHKSRQNFKDNEWVSVSVFNTAKQEGFQLKGKVHFLTDSKKLGMIYKITQSTPKALAKIYDEKIKNENIEVIEFEPRAIYSLDPRQEAGRLLALDKNDETLSKI
jgi:predicted pyridoxine 5'-phosphate oxidase superfamily flavin-nucleotide-binding protein